MQVECPGCNQSRLVRPSDWATRKSDHCRPCANRLRVGLASSKEPSGKGTALYTVWRGMRQRCGHFGGGHAVDLKHYAERGIQVCMEWRSSFAPFKEWANAHGYRPGLMIDRISNDRGYQPDNCRFLTVLESNRHKRTTLDHESVARIREAKLFGSKQCDLAHAYGVSEATISNLVTGDTWR